jgi:hypothetical protein
MTAAAVVYQTRRPRDLNGADESLFLFEAPVSSALLG